MPALRILRATPKRTAYIASFLCRAHYHRTFAYRAHRRRVLTRVCRLRAQLYAGFDTSAIPQKRIEPQSRADPNLRRMLPSMIACRNSPAPEARRRDPYRRINHAISEIAALTISVVVIGKKNLNPGRSMTMPPGRLNKCVFLGQGQSSPATTSAAPSEEAVHLDAPDLSMAGYSHGYARVS